MDAFEIRLELLRLAQSILLDKVYQERERLEHDWQEKAANGTTTPFPVLPTVSAADIVQVAEELNKFISKKD